MRAVQTKPSLTRSALRQFELIYYSIVRNVRKTHGNAIIGLLLSMMQTVIMIAAFYMMIDILGLRKNAIRGDFIIYLMTGIFLYLTHTRAMGAVVGSDGPTSPMMKHGPMNTLVAISAAAISALYLQVLTFAVILFVVHVAWHPVVIYDPIGVIAMLLLAWLSGVAVGLVLLAAKPWFPTAVGLIATVYARANMIASGKMFVANTMPHHFLVFFDWNPLFHTIDQARGFAFINYNPHFSSIGYPVRVSIALIMIGLMGEFYTRKNASLSWFAKR